MLEGCTREGTPGVVGLQVEGRGGFPLTSAVGAPQSKQSELSPAVSVLESGWSSFGCLEALA